MARTWTSMNILERAYSVSLAGNAPTKPSIMILRRALRPQAIAKTLEESSNRSLLHLNRQHTRSLHQLPALGGPGNPIGQKWEAEGIEGLMTPRAFQQIWKVHQQSLVDRINQATAMTEWESKTPKEIHIAMSRQPDKAALYNAAAMAHFNHFFFESLRSGPQTKTLDGEEDLGIPEGLEKDIELSFDGSIDNLRDAMLDHANAIFGNGFVWLVKYPITKAGTSSTYGLKVLCTYNAGSPYSEAYKMRQSVDHTTGVDPVRWAQENQNTPFGRSKYAPMSPQMLSAVGAGRDGFNAPNRLDAIPLLCINVWHHMWVLDYGLSPVGKETYTKAWWQTIDWNVVGQRSVNAGSSSGFGGR